MWLRKEKLTRGVLCVLKRYDTTYTVQAVNSMQGRHVFLTQRCTM